MYATVRGRRVLSRKGRSYREAVRALVMSDSGYKHRRFGSARLCIAIDAYPPDRRQRDLDNLLKAIFDALKYSGVYDDDSQIDDIGIQRLAPQGTGCIDVTVWEAPAHARARQAMAIARLSA